MVAMFAVEVVLVQFVTVVVGIDWHKYVSSLLVLRAPLFPPLSPLAFPWHPPSPRHRPVAAPRPQQPPPRTPPRAPHHLFLPPSPSSPSPPHPSPSGTPPLPDTGQWLLLALNNHLPAPLAPPFPPSPFIPPSPYSGTPPLPDTGHGTPPLPDTGQWLLLALNDHLPAPLTALLRARLVELHDFLMLFMLLAFSVLFNCIPPSGIGLGARYCFTIGLSRLLRNHDLLHQVISTPLTWPLVHYPPEYQPDWGAFQFLVDFLRPMNARAHHGAAASSGAFSSFVIRPYGGCNDLAFSGHIIVAALTACAWQEAFPGWASAMVWGLVFHSAQREVRERQHYSVDVVIALYLAPLLWRTTRFLWSHPPAPPTRREAFGAALSEREAALMKALKDGDLGAVREAIGDAVEEAEGVVSGGVKGKTAGDKAGKDAQTNRLLLPFGIGMILLLFVVVLTAFNMADEGGGFFKLPASAYTTMTASSASQGFPLLRVARKVLNLGTIGLAYVLIEFVCTRTDWLPPHVAAKFPLALWAFLGILGVVQSQRYRHFADEFRNVPKFLACVGFMLLAFVVEVIAVQFVTVVLGLDWHKTVTPLPDTGQWILLGLNDRLPAPLTALLRAPIVEMHDFIMLFMLLAFSVLVGAIPGPGMALGSRYVFSIGLSRILRVATFSSTILPAPRPWCAESRFGDTCPRHPHPWAAKYLTPYSDNPDLLHQLISTDTAFAPQMSYPPEFRPDWGSLQFLVDFLRPMDARVHDGAAASSGAFSSFVVRPYGGCNDLAFSGHIVVAALTACAWQEAHPGWGSAMVWVLVMHAAQRDIRERSHYSVDVIIALYLAPLLWQITRFLWSRPAPPPSRKKLMGLALADREAELVKAVKEGDLDRVKWTVEMARREADAKEKGGEVEGGVEAGNAERRTVTQRYLAHLGTVLILTMLGVVLVAILVSDEGHKAVLEKK
ncbi:unnamed protein product [Closterium sp. NIES-65]|nr:unnamed protein product [Closterium sp. NIES-65]